MKRREIIFGTGSVALASTLVLGSGAFSQVEAQRTLSVSVPNDSTGYLGLVPNDRIGGIRESNAGTLEIDFTDPGLNPNAVFQFGHFVEVEQEIEGFDPKTTEKPVGPDSEFTSGFLVVNQSTMDQQVGLTIEQSVNEGLNALIQVHDSDGNPIGTSALHDENTLSVDLRLDVGDALGVSLMIDTRSSEVSDQFATDISIKSVSIE